MQLRVVTDQPWDVKADVLVIPIVGEAAFDGPLGELDRRTGGELQALAAFGSRVTRWLVSMAIFRLYVVSRHTVYTKCLIGSAGVDERRSATPRSGAAGCSRGFARAP